MRCGDDGVQLHGGNGFIRDYPVEKFMRDAKQLALCAMTAEHADQLAMQTAREIVRGGWLRGRRGVLLSGGRRLRQ